jgi:hypothetical protein
MGKGLWIDSGIGVQTNMARFWINKDKAIMESITVSIDLLLRGFRIPFSKINPIPMTAATARNILKKKFMLILVKKVKRK